MEESSTLLMLLLAQQNEKNGDEIEELGQSQAELQAQVRTLTTQNRALQRSLALADAQNAALEQRLARIVHAVDEGRTVGGSKRRRAKSGSETPPRPRLLPLASVGEPPRRLRDVRQRQRSDRKIT